MHRAFFHYFQHQPLLLYVPWLPTFTARISVVLQANVLFILVPSQGPRVFESGISCARRSLFVLLIDKNDEDCVCLHDV